MPPNPIVVVGASTGGVDALLRLAAGLPEEFVAPLLVVLHVGPHRSILPRLLEREGRRPALHPLNGETMQPGKIYVAPPDNHMLVDGRIIRLSKGPKEHHTRPAIDPLFRSAAVTRGSEVVGVVLTGALNDGTAGLQAIKSCGGRAAVQDPADAVEPSMPASALAWVDIDLCAPMHALPAQLAQLVATTNAPTDVSTDQLAVREQQWFDGEGNIMEHMNQIASPSPFVCPDCKGGLWELTGPRPARFRCHTGHAFTLQTLQSAQTAQTDEALWGAVRALQERELLLERQIHERAADEGPQSTNQPQTQLEVVQERAKMLRRWVSSS